MCYHEGLSRISFHYSPTVSFHDTRIKWDQVVFAVYSLSFNKKRKPYKGLLSALGNIRPLLKASIIMSDFELVFLKTFNSDWEENQARGCSSFLKLFSTNCSTPASRGDTQAIQTLL